MLHGFNVKKARETNDSTLLAFSMARLQETISTVANTARSLHEELSSAEPENPGAVTISLLHTIFQAAIQHIYLSRQGMQTDIPDRAQQDLTECLQKFAPRWKLAGS